MDRRIAQDRDLFFWSCRARSKAALVHSRQRPFPGRCVPYRAPSSQQLLLHPEYLRAGPISRRESPAFRHRWRHRLMQRSLYSAALDTLPAAVRSGTSFAFEQTSVNSQLCPIAPHGATVTSTRLPVPRNCRLESVPYHSRNRLNFPQIRGLPLPDGPLIDDDQPCPFGDPDQ